MEATNIKNLIDNAGLYSVSDQKQSFSSRISDQFKEAFESIPLLRASAKALDGYILAYLGMGTRARRIHKAERTVLEIIHHYGLEHEEVFFAQGVIAQKMGISREWVNKILKRLKKKGFITFTTDRRRYKRRDEAGRIYYVFKNKPNRYSLNPLWKLIYEKSGLKEIITAFAGLDCFLKRIANLKSFYVREAWFKDGFSKKFTQYQLTIFTNIYTDKLPVKAYEKTSMGMPESISKESGSLKGHLLSLLNSKPPEMEQISRDNQQDLVRQRIEQIRQDRDRSEKEREELRRVEALKFISIGI